MSNDDSVQENAINEESSDDLNANGIDSDSNHTQTGSDVPETESVTKSTTLHGGRVVRRKKQTRNYQSQRASFPQARMQVSESKSAQMLEKKFNILSLSQEDERIDTSTGRLDGLHTLSIQNSCYKNIFQMIKIIILVPVPTFLNFTMSLSLIGLC